MRWSLGSARARDRSAEAPASRIGVRPVEKEAPTPLDQLRAEQTRHLAELRPEPSPRWAKTAEIPVVRDDIVTVGTADRRSRRLPRCAIVGLALLALVAAVSLGAAAGVHDPVGSVARALRGPSTGAGSVTGGSSPDSGTGGSSPDSGTGGSTGNGLTGSGPTTSGPGGSPNGGVPMAGETPNSAPAGSAPDAAAPGPAGPVTPGGAPPRVGHAVGRPPAAGGPDGAARPGNGAVGPGKGPAHNHAALPGSGSGSG